MSLLLQNSQRMPKLNTVHGIVAYRSTFLRPGVCEKNSPVSVKHQKRWKDAHKKIGSFFYMLHSVVAD